MATTNQLIARAKVILSRRNDTALEADILTELQAAQERLENEAWLPDMLYAEEPYVLTAPVFDMSVVFSRFLRLHDRALGISYVPFAAPGGEPVHLPQFDTMDQLIQRFPGSLTTGSDPSGYSKVDTFVRVRPSPSASAPVTLQVGFYQGELPLAVGNSNLWTVRAPDYILGTAGKILAQGLRDDKALQVFQGLEASGKARLQRKSFGDEQADQEYVMGDRD